MYFAAAVYPQDEPIPIPRENIFFSTEEDFLSQGPTPPDGNPVISDGDLLISSGVVYMRNHELLQAHFADVDNKELTRFDYGLDAAHVIETQEKLVAFSTELHHPLKRFTAGDLLITNGAVIPNFALLVQFQVPREVNFGLDALHFTGDPEMIVEFANKVKEIPRDEFIANPSLLIEILQSLDIDIWFSTEGTSPFTGTGFIDGDLLSVRQGLIILSNHDALPPFIPAGIPDRGVDFGMDAFAQTIFLRDPTNQRSLDLFSTEIVDFIMPFTDGDIIQRGNGVVLKNRDLILAFEPKVEDLGVDALSIPGKAADLRGWNQF